jgi:predicted lipoprotein with Yx(FWY)xxD motif
MSRTRPTAISVVLVAGAIALGACGSSGSNSGTAGGYGAPTPTTAGSPSTATSTANAGSGTTGSSAVQVAHDAKLGDHLVDAQGRTLYLFEADHGMTTACTGGCVTEWPAATATKASAGKGVDAAKLTTASGEAAHQLAYNGHLLYRFAGDKAAGDANGIGIPEWYAVSPKGTSIETN